MARRPNAGGRIVLVFSTRFSPDTRDGIGDQRFKSSTRSIHSIHITRCKREFYQFNTTLWPAMTVAGRMLSPTLTEYFPAGKETGWLTCLDASCVPEASRTA